MKPRTQTSFEPVFKFDVPKPKPEGVMAHITLCRVRGSHCGEHVYVFWDGREIGQLFRPNWPVDGPEPRWTIDYYGSDCGHLSSTSSEIFGILKLAEHHQETTHHQETISGQLV